MLLTLQGGLAYTHDRGALVPVPTSEPQQLNGYEGYKFSVHPRGSAGALVMVNNGSHVISKETIVNDGDLILTPDGISPASSGDDQASEPPESSWQDGSWLDPSEFPVGLQELERSLLARCYNARLYVAAKVMDSFVTERGPLFGNLLRTDGIYTVIRQAGSDLPCVAEWFRVACATYAVLYSARWAIRAVYAVDVNSTTIGTLWKLIG